MKRNLAIILAVGIAAAAINAGTDNPSARPVSLPRLWGQLAHPDGAKSFHALRQMELNGSRAVGFLSGRLESASAPSADSLDALVRDLGSKDYFTRADAHGRLLSAGPMGQDAIARGLAQTRDLETRRRLQVLQTRARREQPQTASERRQLAAVRALERIGTRDALKAVRALAKGAPDARLTRWADRASTRMAARLKGDARGAMAGGDVGRSSFFACQDVRRDAGVTERIDFGEYRYPATGIVLHEGVAYMGVDHADVGPLICTRIYAIDLKTRRVLWRSGDAEQTVLDTPAVHEGTVYYCSASDGALHALDAETGHEKWRVKADRSACSSPVVDGPTVYFGSNDGTFRAVDTQFGRPLWTYHGEHPMRLAAALGRTLALVPSGPDLLALNRRNGKLQWSISAGMLAGAPAVRKGRVFLATFDEEDRCGKLRALDLQTGKTLWTHRLRNASLHAPAVDDDTVYALGDDRTGLVALDAANGRLKWTARVGKELWFSPVVAGSTVYVAGRTNEKLYAIDARKGTIRWSLDTNASRASGAPAVGEGVVYSGSRRWGLCVITESPQDGGDSSIARK
ncbi:MAG: PQQ-binding-like beta-propeller repeat protein [Phycisphaerae bacterium]